MVRAPGSCEPRDYPVYPPPQPSFTVALNGQGEIVAIFDPRPA